MNKAIALIGFLLASGWAMDQLQITEICPQARVFAIVSAPEDQRSLR